MIDLNADAFMAAYSRFYYTISLILSAFQHGYCANLHWPVVSQIASRHAITLRAMENDFGTQSVRDIVMRLVEIATTESGQHDH
jgi:hypothetical protein